MWKNMLVLLLLLVLSKNVSSSFQGRLYGIDQSLSQSSFVQLISNSSKYDHLLNLGRLSISGGATATKNVNNESYVVAYYISDSFGVPHYYLLTIDVKDTPQVKMNVTINGSGYGSFWQIADDQKQLVGIRESAHSGATLEVATINQITGKVQTRGLYPYGSYSIVMGFARQRRLYYNLIESYLFSGINVDSGKLDINISIPNDYAIYAFVYDELKDRLISLVYSEKVVKKAWFIATIIIDTNSSTIKFERIGNSTIPMEGNYFWSTTYTLALKERQWLTLWSTNDTGDSNTLIVFDIDTGDIIQRQIINHSKYLNNLVYFY